MTRPSYLKFDFFDLEFAWTKPHRSNLYPFTVKDSFTEHPGAHRNRTLFHPDFASLEVWGSGLAGPHPQEWKFHRLMRKDQLGVLDMLVIYGDLLCLHILI